MFQQEEIFVPAVQVGDYAESLERTTEGAEESALLGAVEGTPPAPLERRDRRQAYLALPPDQLIVHLGGLGSSGYINLVSFLFLFLFKDSRACVPSLPQ